MKRSCLGTRGLLPALLGVALAGCEPTPEPPPGVGRPRCAVEGDCRLREAAAFAGVEVGVLPDGGDDELVVSEWDSTTNHGFSWSVIQPERDRWEFRPADRSYRLAREHGLEQTGMHFVWDQEGLDDLAGWVLDITDPTELRAVIRERARVIFGRYPELARIDVVNEPLEVYGNRLHANHFYQVLGPDYVHELFRIVGEEAPPGVELFVNENLVEYLPHKADALVELARGLVDAGAAIDAVGLQTHLFLGDPNWDLLRSTMERISELGLEVLVTELDVPLAPSAPDRPAVQAGVYGRVVETCLSVPACGHITVWGVSDAASWMNWFLGPGLAPLLFDDDYLPKPAYFAFRDALLAGRSGEPPPHCPGGAPGLGDRMPWRGRGPAIVPGSPACQDGR